MKTHRLLCALALCVSLYSCEEQSSDTQTQSREGTYILNNGNWGDNDSTIGIYHPADKKLTANVFHSSNGQKLGDLGQDMISNGEDLYIAVNGSQTIFVTDSKLKIKHQINADYNGSRLSPRTFAVRGEKVYVTYYEGYVGEISSDRSVRLCKVGPNPEGIAVAGEYLYVANSGGMSYPAYNNTISVVSIDTFSEVATIVVNVNPSEVEASSDGNHVYVSSFGNYTDIPAKLQVINTSNRSVKDLEYPSVSAIAKGKDDILYILCAGYDENYNPLPGTIHKHDMKTDKSLGIFISDNTILESAYSISATSDGYIYAGCSDYRTTGDVYVFTSEGMLHDCFDSQGLNPLKAY